MFRCTKIIVFLQIFLVSCFVSSRALASGWQKLIPSDPGFNELFGFSVSISGNTAIVGAFQDHDNNEFYGAAWIFVRSGETWTQQAKLTSSVREVNEFFGSSVAIDGDTVAIGAYGSGTFTEGAVYVFVRSGSTWTEQAKLTSSLPLRSDRLGISVAISSDTIIAGAPLFDRGQSGITQSGAVYVFTRSGTNWSEEAILEPDIPQNKHGFGLSNTIAITGDTVICGAHSDDDKAPDAGAAYVFTRTGTTWTQQAKLFAPDAAERDEFGVSVAIDGDTAVVGANADDDACPANPICQSGSVHVFTRSGLTWAHQSKLIASDAEENDLFGTSVSVSGDRALIGAPNEQESGLFNGSIYAFTRNGSSWSEAAKIAHTVGEFDFFGFSVSIDGDTGIAGAYNDIETIIGQGSATIIENITMCSLADFTNDGVVNGADLGILLAVWGPLDTPADLNNDAVTNGADLGLLLSVWGPCL